MMIFSDFVVISAKGTYSNETVGIFRRLFYY